MEKRKKAKRLAAGLVTYWIAEAWHELDNDYYKKGIGTAGNRCEDAGARRWQLYRNHWRWLYGVSGIAESIASAEK